MKNAVLVRLLAVVMLSGFLVGAGVGAANALSVNGATGLFYANPHNYLNWANINNSTDKASAFIKRQNGSAMPLGTVAVQARLFRSDNNNLCTASAYSYNASISYQFANSTNGSYCGPINHYSIGLTKASAGGLSWIQYATFTAGPIAF